MKIELTAQRIFDPKRSEYFIKNRDTLKRSYMFVPWNFKPISDFRYDNYSHEVIIAYEINDRYKKYNRCKMISWWLFGGLFCAISIYHGKYEN